MHRLILTLLVLPVQVFAQQSRYLVVGTGTSYKFWEIAGRIVAYMSGAIAAISVAMFVIGAFLYTISGIKEDYKQKGKDMMIGSILALAVVSGAYAILRTVDYFLTA